MENSVNNVDQAKQTAEKDNFVQIADNAGKIADEQHKAAKKRTVGNVVYDFGVFGSAAWGGVSAVSAIGAHEAMHGTNKHFNWLRSLNKNMSSGLISLLSKGIMKNAKPETVEAIAKNITMVFTLGMGGHTLTAPIKWMEDHRQSNAAKIDKLLGTTPPDCEDIAKEPKQSWKSVLSGRMLSWASAFAVVLAVPHKIISTVNDACGKKGAQLWTKLRPKSNPAAVRKWSDIISFDIIFTALTATVTYAFSRFVAKKGAEKLDNVEDSLYQLNPAAPNPLGDEEEPQKKTSFADKVKSECKDSTPAASFLEKVQSQEAQSHARV